MLQTYVRGLHFLPEITSVEFHHECMWSSSFYNSILKECRSREEGSLISVLYKKFCL